MASTRLSARRWGTYAALGVTCALLGHSANAKLLDNDGRAPTQTGPAGVPGPLPTPTVESSAQRIAIALEAKNAYDQSPQGQKEAYDAAQAALRAAEWAGRMFWAAIAETAVTLIGVLLVGLTLFYTKRTAEAASDAAKTAKKVFTELERPWMFFAAHPDSPYQLVSDGSPDIQPVVSFQWRNAGRSPGIIKSGRYRLMVAAELPVQPIYENDGRSGEQIVPAGSESVTEKWKHTAALSASDQANLDAGIYKLFFFGELRYQDVHGGDHRTGIALEHVKVSGFWTQAGDEAYNYRT